MDVKTLATQWQRQIAGFGKQALLKVSDAIELLKDPSPEELQALAEAAAQPSAQEIPSTSVGIVSFSILVLTLVVGLIVASLTLLSQRKPSAEATASATTKSVTSATRPVESYDLPLPPSALPPPPSAPLGATMMMEPSKKAIGTSEGNVPKSEDFEIVPKPKWHEKPFR